MRKIITMLLMLLMTAALTPGVGFADEIAITKVSGVEELQVENIKKGENNPVIITPSNGRVVNLQILEGENNWITKETFLTKDEIASELDLKFPLDWKNKIKSKWRIYIPPVSGVADEYISNTIEITSYNVKNLNLTCKSAVLMRVSDGAILYDKGMNVKRANASTTKMMTAIVALENSDLYDVVKISRNTVRTPWRGLYFREKERFYLEDLLKAMLVSSDNGAATAIGEYVGGNVREFSKMVNNKAKEIGCLNTNFKNPHGLDAKGHYSTAYDLGLILSYGLKNEDFRGIIKRKSYKISDVYENRTYRGKNLDKLVAVYEGSLGGKTGWTDNAGGCYAGAFQYNGVEYIAVVLNSKTGNMFKDTKKLFEYAKMYDV